MKIKIPSIKHPENLMLFTIIFAVLIGTVDKFYRSPDVSFLLFGIAFIMTLLVIVSYIVNMYQEKSDSKV